VHPIGGNVLCYLDLARCLGPDQPVYGLQTPEPNGEPPAIERLAQRYLEAVRAAQPRGPYALGGWSLGGLIAFEMARRLHELGERCEPLVLIDSHAPRPPAADPEPADDLAARFARDFLRSSGLELEIPDLPAGGGPEERLRWLYEQGLAAGLLPPELAFGEIRRLFTLFQLNTEALRRYAAAPSPHEVVIFRAAGSAGQGADPALGWGRLAGGVELHELPGDHYTILRRPVVETLARRLAPLLGTGGAQDSGAERHRLPRTARR
jgi:thioesterase domain-containing protein